MEPIRVAIIGQGRSGRDIHASYLRTDDRYRIVAVAELDEHRRTLAQQEFACDGCDNYKKLFRRKDVDLIVNASLSRDHVPITLDCLRHGFNVLCDKPLAENPKDVDKLIAASEKSGKLLAIFQQSRFVPAYQQLRRIIDGGVLGRIVQIDVQVNGFARRWDWQTLQENMAGNLLNTGPHPLDQVLQLAKYDGVPEVWCHMDRVNTFGDAEDHVHLMMRQAGKPAVSMEVSSCCAYPAFNYNVYGSLGGARIIGAKLEWKFFRPDEAAAQQLVREPLSNQEKRPAYCSEQLPWHEESWTPPAEDAETFRVISRYYYEMLYRFLRDGGPLEITPQQVRQQVAIIQLCQKQNPHIYTRWAKKTKA